MSALPPMIVSKECCDCQEVDNNDLGPCDDCGGCTVTLSISTPTLSCAGVAYVATVDSTIPAGETVVSLTFDYGHYPDDVNNTYVGGQVTAFNVLNPLLLTPLTSSLQLVLVTDAGTTCTSNIVTSIPTQGSVNNGWLLESILFEHSGSPTSQNPNVMTFSNPDSTRGDVYMLPGGNVSTTPAANMGTPCGCREQYFTVDGDFKGKSDRLEIWYKTDKASNNWIQGSDFHEDVGTFSNKTFCKPAGYGWMAFGLQELPVGNTGAGSNAWEFEATRTYGTCPP